MCLCHLIIFSSGGGGAHCCCDSSGKSGGGGEVEPRQFQSERAGGEDDAVAAYTDTWSISIHTLFLLSRWRSEPTTSHPRRSCRGYRERQLRRHNACLEQRCPLWRRPLTLKPHPHWPRLLPHPRSCLALHSVVRFRCETQPREEVAQRKTTGIVLESDWV